jgi:hypothetical protein
VVRARFGLVKQAGRIKMLKTRKDDRAEFAFEMVMKLGGGFDNYSLHTQSAIWAECYRNEEVKRLAGMYLIGSSERAELNLNNLKQKLYEMFLDRTGR